MAKLAGISLICIVALFQAAFARDYSSTDESLIEVGFFGGTKALLAVPEQPKALVVLFPGGDGAMNFKAYPTYVVMSQLEANFLVRSRKYFFQRDIAFLVVDSPGGRPMTPLQRLSALGQVKSLVEKAVTTSTKLKGVPVWGVGTSAGTISLAGLLDYSPDILAGAVFTSSVTRTHGAPGVWSSANSDGVASMPIGDFKKPVLVLSHKDDQCKDTPAADAELLTSRFKSSSRKLTLIVGNSSRINGDPCEAYSPHGFYDQEEETVNKIVDFLLAAQ